MVQWVTTHCASVKARVQVPRTRMTPDTAAHICNHSVLTAKWKQRVESRRDLVGRQQMTNRPRLKQGSR